MTIIEQFNREIKGEKLLYEKKNNFSKEEIELVLESVCTRMMTNPYYTSMIYTYIPTLVDEVLPNVDNSELIYDLRVINAHLERHRNMYLDSIGEESDFGQYCARGNYGIAIPYNYFNTVCDNVMDGEKFEEIISSDWGMHLYNLNINFLITANFLFVRHPNFYNDEYVEHLQDMISFNDKKRILDKEELKRFRRAEKTTLKHIKGYYKKRKAEEKGLQKVKKR